MLLQTNVDFCPYGWSRLSRKSLSCLQTGKIHCVILLLTYLASTRLCILVCVWSCTLWLRPAFSCSVFASEDKVELCWVALSRCEHPRRHILPAQHLACGYICIKCCLQRLMITTKSCTVFVTLQMLVKCADIGHLAAAPRTHKRWATQLEEEFFRQVTHCYFVRRHTAISCGVALCHAVLRRAVSCCAASCCAVQRVMLSSYVV